MDSPTLPMLPENVTQIDSSNQFEFSCHKGVSCFTECCRLLELALTPYDILRLRYSTQLSSRRFLDEYVIEEFEEEDIFPRFYLTMVDDGRASCVFVVKEGCTVYTDRPGACRAYPLGRAVMRQNDGTTKEQFVLIHEEHCQGFDEKYQQNSMQYSTEQGLDKYNRFNDAVAELTQHQRIRNGFRPSAEQRELYTLALYDLDTFRQHLIQGMLPTVGIQQDTIVKWSDEELLLYAIKWLQEQLF